LIFKFKRQKVINKYIPLYFVGVSTLSAVLGYFFFSATNTLIYRLFLGGWWVSDSKVVSHHRRLFFLVRANVVCEDEV
jgi:hypothetical protein